MPRGPSSNYSAKSTARISSLDGLRGICALTVVFFHWWLLQPSAWNFVSKKILPPYTDLQYFLAGTPLNVFVAGSVSVSIFFVISGAVLALTFSEIDKEQFAPFALKRFCRIYLPYFVVVVASFCAMMLLHPRRIEGLSSWFNTYAWSHRISPITFLNYLLMTGHDTTLDPVVWSLDHELRISFLFPVMFIFLRRGGTVALGSILLASFGAGAALRAFHTNWIVAELLSSIQYLWLFAFGAALFLLRVHVKEICVRAPMKTVALWLLALLLISISTRIDPLLGSGLSFCLSGIAAVLIVGLTLAPNWVSNKLFDSPPAIWLGKISYSLYLLHIPILLCIMHLFFGKLPLFVLFAVGISATLAMSWGMAVTIDRSSQQLGRRLATVYREAEKKKQYCLSSSSSGATRDQ